jgi:Rrf2 family protein
MSKSCRFAVAIHIVTLLAMYPQHPRTSDWIARSVNTNPVVVRRLLAALGRAGLTQSVRGSSGGTVLTKSARDMTLLEIQQAVEEPEGPQLHHQPPNHECPVGRGIQPVLLRVLQRADAARDSVLATTLLSEVIASLRDEDI